MIWRRSRFDGRPAGNSSNCRIGFAFSGHFQALFLALFGFAVEGLCDRCWAADFTEQQDFQVKVSAFVGDSQHVSNSDGARGFEGLSGGLNSAEIAGFGGERSRLEEAGGPQPLVDSYGGAQIYFPASSRFTASLTCFPSTRMPAPEKRAMTFFITVPISFIVGAPISAMTSLTPAVT